MSTTTIPFATEHGHFYDKLGNPAYDVPKASIKAKCTDCTGDRKSAAGKARTAACLVCDPEGYVHTENPETRPAHLGDARKLDLCRGVTTIIRVMAAPGLERYKQMQLCEAAYTAPKDIASLPFPEWLAKIEADAKAHARQAAQRGTDIHATIERGLRGESLEGYLYAEWFDVFVKECTTVFGSMPEFEPERSFTCVEQGYGCKVDAICRKHGMVLDLKTKDFKEGEAPELQDEHMMQLAGNATAAGMRGATCGIVFIDRQKPQVVIRMATSEQMQRGWGMFECCLKLSRLLDSYAPSWIAA